MHILLGSGSRIPGPVSSPVCSTHTGGFSLRPLQYSQRGQQVVCRVRLSGNPEGLFVLCTHQTHRCFRKYVFSFESSNTLKKLYSGVQHSLWEWKSVWWMPRLYKAMKDVEWLRKVPVRCQSTVIPGNVRMGKPNRLRRLSVV